MSDCRVYCISVHKSMSKRAQAEWTASSIGAPEYVYIYGGSIVYLCICLVIRRAQAERTPSSIGAHYLQPHSHNLNYYDSVHIEEHPSSHHPYPSLAPPSPRRPPSRHRGPPPQPPPRVLRRTVRETAGPLWTTVHTEVICDEEGNTSAHSGHTSLYESSATEELPDTGAETSGSATPINGPRNAPSPMVQELKEAITRDSHQEHVRVHYGPEATGMNEDIGVIGDVMVHGSGKQKVKLGPGVQDEVCTHV